MNQTTPETIHLSAGQLTAEVWTRGAILRAVHLEGVAYNLTRGTDDLAAYNGDWRYHGPIIGPIVNRISNARVKIDGMMHELERNQDGRIHLHSGKGAAQFQDWRVAAQSDSSVTLVLALADGACGLPGAREISATYAITAPATLSLTITALSDADTMMNFAQHGYWNMDGSDTWAGHVLRVAADRYLPTDTDACPTGEIAPVSGTPFDFQQAVTLSRSTHALDHNLCLSDIRQPLRDVAWLTGTSGVEMVMATTETGLQIFDGRSAPTDFGAIALEAQSWPDAPNHRGFPAIKYRAGAPYTQTTTWSFTA